MSVAFTVAIGVSLLALSPVPSTRLAVATSQHDELQVITYIDLEPTQAASAATLLVDQVREEQREPGCHNVLLINEQGRPNHFMAVETWQTERDLNTFRKSGSYKRFRSNLQPMLASPLDERIGHQVGP